MHTYSGHCTAVCHESRLAPIKLWHNFTYMLKYFLKYVLKYLMKYVPKLDQNAVCTSKIHSKTHIGSAHCKHPSMILCPTNLNSIQDRIHASQILK